jgi:hypothetical protein
VLDRYFEETAHGICHFPKEILSQISTENKMGRFISKICKHEKTKTFLIGQIASAIT